MIRHYILFLLLLPIALSANMALFTQGPEPIYPLTKVIKSLEYYEEQALAWQTITKQSPDRNDAWWNFYVAARNIQVLTSEESYDLGAIVEDVTTAIPNSFERYYLAFWESPIQNRRYDLLLRAHAIAPERTEAYHDLITYFKLQNEQDKVQEYCQLWLASGTLSSGILDWNYNMLMSVGANSILLNQGDNDTYPTWVLQTVKGIRTDVKVLNVYLLLHNDDYRERIFNELGLPKLETTENIESLFRHFFQYAQHPVYLGIATADPRKLGANYFFLTGLAFRYSSDQFDNMGQLVNNYEKHFRLDNLQQSFIPDPSQSVVDQINMNYVPSLILLNRHYHQNGATQKANETRDLSLQIAEQANQLDQVSIYFDLPGHTPFFNSLIDIRPLQKNMRPLEGKLFASATEVTNGEYELFLKDLLNQGKTNLLERCKMHSVNWRSLLPAGMQALSDAVLYDENGHPESPEIPIVNISYEAAQVYCDWLTTVYNQSRDKRKKYKKVLFRLPTEAEWEKAARGGHELAPFPWGGYYAKNAKGCYLTNINPYLNVFDEQNETFSSNIDAESPGEDGAFFPAVADAYFPNDVGLYNMSGNVAEMVQEREFTKGGSWLEPLYYAQISSQHYQPTPSPAVGFRIFMEVLEDK